jgi:hypothetical protein
MFMPCYTHCTVLFTNIILHSETRMIQRNPFISVANTHSVQVTTWRRHSDFVYGLLLTPKHFYTSKIDSDFISEK